MADVDGHVRRQMGVAADRERASDPRSVGSRDARSRPEPRHERVQVACVALSLDRRGLGRDELVPREDRDRGAPAARLHQGGGERREQLIAKRSERRLLVERGAEERAGQAVDALGRAGRVEPAARRRGELQELAVERLVRLRLDPHHDQTRIRAGQDEEIVVARLARDVVEPRPAFGDPALELDAGEPVAHAEHRRETLGTVASRPRVGQLVRAAVFAPVMRRRRRREPAPVGRRHDRFAAVVGDRDAAGRPPAGVGIGHAGELPIRGTGGDRHVRGESSAAAGR